MASNPDDEVLLFLFEYEPAKVFVHMDGTTNSDIGGDEDMQHIRSVLDNPPSQKEEISIAEAGLIWYFQPEFNIKLRDSYPHEKLKLLSSCYNFDLCGLIVEVNTEEFPVRLYSKVRPAADVTPNFHPVLIRASALLLPMRAYEARGCVA